MSEGPRMLISMSFGVFLYRRTNFSEEPAALTMRVRSLTDLTHSHFPKSERNTYVVKYVCMYVYIYNSVHVKPKLPNRGI